jgi:CheY-like chemotaxis protein
MSSLNRPTPVLILLVEDNFVNQRLATALLEEAGHTVVLASSGTEALAALSRHSFDLVLMDVQLPDMDGIAATAAIRAQESASGRHLPILAMTANAGVEDRERCLAAGMDGFIAKPISYQELVTRIEDSMRAAGDRRPAAPPPAVERLHFDLGEGLSRLFLSDAERLHDEMSNAIGRHDAQALEDAAHSLLGAAGLFDAATVTVLARRLLQLGKAGTFNAESALAIRQLADELERLKRSAEV